MSEAVAHLLGDLVAQPQHRQRTLGVASQLLDQRALVGQLVVVGQEALALGHVLERVQEHRLADATEALGDDALLRLAALEAGRQDPELLKLRVAAGKLWRPRARVRRIWVLDGVHVITAYTRL